jgi:hypothetical protein
MDGCAMLMIEAGWDFTVVILLLYWAFGLGRYPRWQICICIFFAYSLAHSMISSHFCNEAKEHSSLAPLKLKYTLLLSLSDSIAVSALAFTSSPRSRSDLGL